MPMGMINGKPACVSIRNGHLHSGWQSSTWTSRLSPWCHCLPTLRAQLPPFVATALALLVGHLLQRAGEEDAERSHDPGLRTLFRTVEAIPSLSSSCLQRTLPVTVTGCRAADLRPVSEGEGE